jgi:hypothetical protein
VKILIMERMQTTKLRNNTFTQLLAIGGLAIGSIATISAAPAGAVLLSTGQLAFGEGTSDFYSAGDPNSYNVSFNPGALASISSATDSFSSAFTPFTFSGVNANSPAIFNRVVGSTFSLESDLIFNFTNGVSISLDGGSTFLRTTNDANGVGFSNTTVVGSVTNADGTVNLQAVSFTLNDNINPGGGTYSITVSPTAVPEPFTVIGTIVGGTAAFRMRKKLAAANKK